MLLSSLARFSPKVHFLPLQHFRFIPLHPPTLPWPPSAVSPLWQEGRHKALPFPTGPATRAWLASLLLQHHPEAISFTRMFRGSDVLLSFCLSSLVMNLRKRSRRSRPTLCATGQDLDSLDSLLNPCTIGNIMAPALQTRKLRRRGRA